MCVKQFFYQTTGDGSKTQVLIQSGLIGNVASAIREVSGPRQCFIISDTNVVPLYAEGVRQALTSTGCDAHLYIVEAGEHSKSWEVAGHAYTQLAKTKHQRDRLIVAVGGGVVGDLAGFVASTWMRGVPWINCPTTMEADIDACVGGKTAINLPEGKNLVGAFHHPLAVLIDPDCLSTLSERDVRAGLAEGIKHAALQSVGEVGWLAGNAERIVALQRDTVAELIERNLRFKASIVSEDPCERSGRRMILNFGHSIGHAIELLAGGQLRHGECVGLGMLAESRIAVRAGMMSDADLGQLQDLLKCFELPSRLDVPIKPDEVWASIQLDKKNVSGLVRMVLLEGFGSPVVRDNVSREWVCDAVASLG